MAELQCRFALDDTPTGVGAFAPTPDSAAQRVLIRARNGTGKIRLQVRSRAQLDRAALGRALGTVPFPDSPQANVSGTPAIFWTAPGEWLITGDGLNAADCAEKLAGVLDGRTRTVTDLSSGLAVIELSGERSLDLLASCCSIDFHGPDGEPGRYVISRMHQLPVLIHRADSGQMYHIYADRSVAQYLLDWMRQVIV